MKRKAKEDKTERSETKNWDFTKNNTHCLIEGQRLIVFVMLVELRALRLII